MSIRDDLWWLAETVRLEAGGELYLGQLAVAFVVCTRRAQYAAQTTRTVTIREAVLSPQQFSCWNTSNNPRMYERELPSCWKAACAAYFRLVDDPAFNANHYLRTDLSPKPSWFDPIHITATIGAHTFLRLS